MAMLGAEQLALPRDVGLDDLEGMLWCWLYGRCSRMP
jgi:hypothetical protein